MLAAQFTYGPGTHALLVPRPDRIFVNAFFFILKIKFRYYHQPERISDSNFRRLAAQWALVGYGHEDNMRHLNELPILGRN